MTECQEIHTMTFSVLKHWRCSSRLSWQVFQLLPEEVRGNLVSVIFYDESFPAHNLYYMAKYATRSFLLWMFFKTFVFRLIWDPKRDKVHVTVIQTCLKVKKLSRKRGYMHWLHNWYTSSCVNRRSVTETVLRSCFASSVASSGKTHK